MGLEGSMWAPANRAKLATVQAQAQNNPDASKKPIPTGPAARRGPGRGNFQGRQNHHHGHGYGQQQHNNNSQQYNNNNIHQPNNNIIHQSSNNSSQQPNDNNSQKPNDYNNNDLELNNNDQLTNNMPIPQITHTPAPVPTLPPATHQDSVTITPAVPASPPQPSHSPSIAAVLSPDRPLPAQELDRYTHIIARLNWKIPTLDYGYFQATEAIRRFGVRECSIYEVRHQVAMFKLDFFEFYMLIERALVRILGVFGVSITSQRRGETSSSSDNKDVPASFSKYSHAYHQNVLDALEDPALPIHSVLGSDAVNGSLQRAKDLRNMWKYAHIGNPPPNGDEPGAADDASADAFSLDQYELRSVLETIISALALAKDVGHQRVQDMIAAGETTPAPAVSWDFMADAMDWEAI